MRLWSGGIQRASPLAQPPAGTVAEQVEDPFFHRGKLCDIVHRHSLSNNGAGGPSPDGWERLAMIEGIFGFVRRFTNLEGTRLLV